MSRKHRKWWIAGAALVAVIVLALVILPRRQKPVQTGNLLINGDFSRLDALGLPEGWYTDDYMKTPGYTEYSAADGVVTIVNHERNDARFAQSVEVEPDSLYCFSGEILSDAQGGLGANLSVSDIYVFSDSMYDTKGEWRIVRLYGRTGKNQHQVTLFVRLGGYSGEATGTASFRNVSLEQVASLPADAYETAWYDASAQTADKSGTSGAAWPWLTLIACGYLLACYALRCPALADQNDKKTKLRGWTAMGALLLIAALARLLIASLIPGYGVDIGCFTYWGNFMAETGAKDFYNTVGFCDYPPGYILVLGLLGRIGKSLGTGMTEMLVKLPSIVCDVAAAAMLYAFGRKRRRRKAAFVLATLYAFNPLTFAAGAAWGQADSVMTLCLLGVVMLALDDRWIAALPLYMLSVLMKPQALMFGPLGLLALVYLLIRKGNKRLYIHAAIGLLLAAGVGLAVILPFSPNMDNSEGWWIIRLYQSTMGYYDKATVNACNLYFLFGKNWMDVETAVPWFIRLCASTLMLGSLIAVGVRAKWYARGILRLSVLCAAGAAVLLITVIPMTYSSLGTVVIAFGVLLCVGLYIAAGDIRHLPLLGALLLLLLCSLGVMMHERYLFAAVALLALACLIEKDRRVYLLFAAVSALVFLNVGLVLDRGVRIGGVDGHLHAPLFGISSDSAALEYLISALLCVTACFGCLTATSICAEGEQAVIREAAEQTASDASKDAVPSPAVAEWTCPQTVARMNWVDWLLMLGLTAIYAVVAFVNLGSTTSPQTWWRSVTAADSVVLDLGENHAFNMLYLGGIHRIDQEFIVRVSDDGETWSEPYWAEIQEGQCFKWQYVRENTFYDGVRHYASTPELLIGRYVRIEAQGIGTTIYEVILRDPETQAVYPVSLVTGNGQNLIDEQDTFTGEPGWYNSTYFDEIYHARTGYEHYLAMRGDYTYMPYETSHPPLGKVLMAFSIGIFGMTPFGWRFAGALAGVLMLPGMYMLGKLLTKRRLMAFAAMFLMAVDFMHFTQTRIATIDSFVVLFILWSFVFMVYYLRMDYWGKPLWKTLVPLFLSGLFMGLSVASKWTGCYAGMGLALLFFWSLYRRFTQALEARRFPDDPRARVAEKELYRRPVITLACCLVFFIAIPLTIYYVSYIPYFLPYTPSGVTVKRVIQAAVGDWLYGGAKGGMLGYHSTPGLGMDHPFYTPWYDWPIMKKPMWYYSSEYRPQGATQTIVAFGNPLVWWGGLAALIAVAVIWMARHFDRRSGLTLHTRQNDMRPAILLIGFAAQYVPWMLVPRGTYIYHYFPSVPFIILCIVLCMDLLADVLRKPVSVKDLEEIQDLPMPAITRLLAMLVALLRRWRWLYAALTVLLMAVALALFIAFFPYISGMTAGNGWLRAMQWFNGWIYY